MYRNSHNAQSAQTSSELQACLCIIYRWIEQVILCSWIKLWSKSRPNPLEVVLPFWVEAYCVTLNVHKGILSYLKRMMFI